MWRPAVLLCSAAAICAAATACGEIAPDERDGRDREAAAATAEEPPGRELGCTDVTERGLRIPTRTRADLIRALGEPDGLDSRAVAAPPDTAPEAAVDSVFRLRWPGLEVSGHRPAEGEEAIDEVVVRSNHYLRFPDLGIGVPPERLVEVLGAPGAREGDHSRGRLVYACHTSPARDDPVAFVVEDGLVDEIVYTFFMD